VYANAEEMTLMSEICESDVEDIGVTEKVFSLTADGRKIALILREAIHRRRPQDIRELDELLLKFGNMPLNQLIRYVYRRHQDMTVNSIHPEAKRIAHA
jgi:hypothetical protein